MSERELRIWAEAHAPAGCGQAAAVLVLLDEVAALRRQVAGHVERIAAQSEILSRRAGGAAARAGRADEVGGRRLPARGGDGMTRTSWPVASEIRDLVDAGLPGEPAPPWVVWVFFVPVAAAVLVIPAWVRWLTGEDY